jgi:hypothetical protein
MREMVGLDSLAIEQLSTKRSSNGSKVRTAKNEEQEVSLGRLQM